MHIKDGVAEGTVGMTASEVPDSVLAVHDHPVREWAISLHDHVNLTIRGPAALAVGVAEYFWPQVRPARQTTGLPTIELVRGAITANALAGLPQQKVVLYSSPAGHVPDFNVGTRYYPDWGLDRLVVNPHNGTQVLVAGQQVRVLNQDLELGVRDAVRVVLQLVATNFEARGAFTVHASSFTIDGQVVAVTGHKGAGKTTTALAAVAAGATLISNDRTYATPSAHGTMIEGWADPIRILRNGPGLPKDVIPLVRYFRGNRRRVAAEPSRLTAVVVPHVSDTAIRISCEEIGPDEGRAAVAEQVLPQRTRWLGLEPEPRRAASDLTADRYLRLSYPYPAARQAIEVLRGALR
jgi:hypothetical protein